MFLGGGSMCVADLVCYFALVAPMEAFPSGHRYAICSVSRWFDYMQHAVIDGLAPPAEIFGKLRKVAIDCNMPDPPPTLASLPVLVAAPGSTSAAAVGATPTGGGAAAAVDVSDGTAAPKQQGGKSEARAKKDAEKAAKKEAKASAAPADAAGGKKEAGAGGGEADGQSDISKLDIRVGLIISAERHPEAEKLYVEKVDVGDESGPRTVVSGLVDFMPASELTNRRAVLLCNLKPAKMRGIESQAMVLAASNADHTTVELLKPPDACAIGERVVFKGCPGEPFTPQQVNKKKVWEAVAPLLSTNDACVAMYKDLSFDTAHGPCTVASIKGGGIK